MILIKKGSLLSRVYSYWVRKGGRPPRVEDKKLVLENLCHFCRVVFGWTLLRWFFMANVQKIVAPWSITLAACILTGFYFYPTQSLFVLEITIAIIVAMAFIAAIGFGVNKLGESKYGQRIVQRLGTICKPLVKILAFRITTSLPIWFFICASLLALGLQFVFEVVLVFSIAVLAIAITAVPIFFLCEYLCDLCDSRREAGKKIGQAGPIKVIVEWLKAKKQKICPQIAVELT